jgi:hypothetical protein
MLSWPRDHFAPGGGNAHLFYKVHGRFDGAPRISRSQHRTQGVPDGCELTSFSAGDEGHTVGLDEIIGDRFRQKNAALYAASREAPHALILRGEIEDPPTLDYLRDAVGVVTALVQGGGVSIFDAYTISWLSPAQWLERIFEPAAAVPTHHVTILVSDDWYHTRGMLKFGRPDLSVRGVRADLEEPVIDLLNRFIQMQAFGGVVPEGQPVKMKSLPAGWVCRHRGSLDDPDFNNRHIEIGPA